MENRFRKSLINFIKKIEKANEQQFGNERLDCCGLNSTKQQNKTLERRVKNVK